MSYLEEEHTIDSSDTIICPYCKEDYGDEHWHYLDCSNDNISDDMNAEVTCENCNKVFHLHFDFFNQNYGYSMKKSSCKRNHKWFISDDCYESSYYDSKRNISRFSRYYKCKKCPDYKFIPLKEDKKTEYTKKEISQYKLKNREIPKEDQKFTGKKSGIINDKHCRYTIRTDNAEGNRQLWFSILKVLRKCGFIIIKDSDIEKHYKILSKSHRYGICKEDLEVKTDYYPAGMEFKFYQNINLKERKKGDGEYEFNKYDLMSYLQKLRLKKTFRTITKFLKEKHNFKEDETNKKFWHGDSGPIELKYLQSLSSKKEIIDFIKNHPEKNYSNYYNIKNGDYKIGRDYKHKITGIGQVFYQANSSYFLVGIDNNKVDTYQGCNLFDYTPGKIKYKDVPIKDKIKKLEDLKKESVKMQDYEKCIIYRDLINKLEKELSNEKNNS